MAKTRATRKTQDSYTIKSTNKSIKPGDCVLMRPSHPSKPSYVAKVEKIESDAKGSNVKVHVQWYYRPEESIGGRRQFHGTKEVFLSDHHDVQSADSIEGKCRVHTFKSYTKLDAVGNDDFFSRFEYNSATGAFNPDRVAVYCKCEMPYNPDDLMVQCDGCTDWFHPACIQMTPEEAKQIDHFFCENCSTEEQKLLHATSRHTKEITKRIKEVVAQLIERGPRFLGLSTCSKSFEDEGIAVVAGIIWRDASGFAHLGMGFWELRLKLFLLK